MNDGVSFTAITTSLAFCVAAQFLQIFIFEESVTIPRRLICLVALNRTSLVLHQPGRLDSTPRPSKFLISHVESSLLMSAFNVALSDRPTNRLSPRESLHFSAILRQANLIWPERQNTDVQ